MVNNLLCVTEYHELSHARRKLYPDVVGNLNWCKAYSLYNCMILRFGISLRKVVGPLPYVPYWFLWSWKHSSGSYVGQDNADKMWLPYIRTDYILAYVIQCSIMHCHVLRFIVYSFASAFIVPTSHAR